MELLQRDLSITRGCDGLGRCAQLLTLLLAFPRYAEKARELRLSGLPLVRAEGPSEAAESWYMLFHAFAEAYKTFTGESAKIAAMIIDQNYAAPKAAKMVDAFKEATICNDVVHLYRAVEEKHKDKMKNPLFLYTYKEDVRRLHMCPTLASMRRLWSLLYLSWVAMGEKDVAEWFNDYVMKDGDFTQNFYYTACGMLGSLPYSQAIESLHKFMMKARTHAGVLPCKSDISRLLHECYPKLCIKDSTRVDIEQIKAGPPRTSDGRIVLPLQTLLNVNLVRPGGVAYTPPQGSSQTTGVWYVNSKAAAAQNLKVDAARLSAHQECLQGECGSVVTLAMLDGSLIGLQKGIESYIQAVRRLYHVTWSEETRRFECMCYGFQKSLMCSHVILVMHVEGVIDVREHLRGKLPAGATRASTVVLLS